MLWIHPTIFEIVVKVENAFNETIVEANAIICNKLNVLEYENVNMFFILFFDILEDTLL